MHAMRVTKKRRNPFMTNSRNMTTSWGKPKKTPNTVFIERRSTSKAVYTFNDIQVMLLRPSPRVPGAFTLTCRFPTDVWAADALDAIDAEALSATLDHNGDWFKNALTTAQIAEYFEPSVERRVKLAQATFHISAKHMPKLSFDGVEMDLDALYEKWRNCPPAKKTANASVEVTGLLFEKQKFRLRLVVRSLEVVSRSDGEIDVLPDRDELEAHWRSEISAAFLPEIEMHEKCLQKCKEAHEALLEKLNVARRTPNPATWDAELNGIANALFKLRSGLWNYLI